MEEGHVAEDARAGLIRNFGAGDYGIAHLSWAFSQMAVDSSSEGRTDARENALPPPETCKAMLLGLIDMEIKRLRDLVQIVCEREALELEATAASLSLPPKEVADKILRYVAAIERQLYRAMNELERAQRRRREESVPPPLNIEVSGKG